MNSSQSIPHQSVPDSSRGAIAPAWHTAVVLFVMLGFSLLSAFAKDLTVLPRIFQYLLVLVVEWGVVAFIWRGVGRRGTRMADLVGGSWARPLAVLRDLGLAIAFILVCGGAILQGLGYLLKATPNKALHNILPQSHAEIILWLLMSLTAGFCEEVIFRGYLRRQFSALTHSAAGGIVFQGIAFGLAHGYQGWKYMLMIAVYGILFGLLAHWRRSLRPGMLAHALQDGILGILARHLMD